MSKGPLTREELDRMRCQNPGCNCGGELFLHPRCHPQDGVEVMYHKGLMHIRCNTCKSAIQSFEIASSVRLGTAEIDQLLQVVRDLELVSTDERKALWPRLLRRLTALRDVAPTVQ